MRKFISGSELLHLAPTRFATNFITLQSMLSFKNEVEGMVTSKEWHELSHSKEIKGKQVAKLILDSSFWKECAIVVKATKPFVRVLRIVDSDTPPSMGYLLDCIPQKIILFLSSKEKEKIEAHL